MVQGSELILESDDPCLHTSQYHDSIRILVQFLTFELCDKMGFSAEFSDLMRPRWWWWWDNFWWLDCLFCLCYESFFWSKHFLGNRDFIIYFFYNVFIINHFFINVHSCTMIKLQFSIVIIVCVIWCYHCWRSCKVQHVIIFTSLYESIIFIYIKLIIYF